jgi:hypothetical protein
MAGYRASCPKRRQVSIDNRQTLEHKGVILTGRLVLGKQNGPRSPEPIWLTPLLNHASEIGAEGHPGGPNTVGMDLPQEGSLEAIEVKREHGARKSG